MKWIRTRQQHNYRMVLKSKGIKEDFSRYTSAVQKVKKQMDQVLYVTNDQFNHRLSGSSITRHPSG